MSQTLCSALHAPHTFIRLDSIHAFTNSPLVYSVKIKIGSNDIISEFSDRGGLRLSHTGHEEGSEGVPQLPCNGKNRDRNRIRIQLISCRVSSVFFFCRGRRDDGENLARHDRLWDSVMLDVCMYVYVDYTIGYTYIQEYRDNIIKCWHASCRRPSSNNNAMQSHISDPQCSTEAQYLLCLYLYLQGRDIWRGGTLDPIRLTGISHNL